MDKFEYTKKQLANGISQRQIAKDLNVDHATIRYWIKNNFTTLIKHNLKSPDIPIQICKDNAKHYAYILGCYLGDGYISKTSRTYKLRIYNNANDLKVINQQVISLGILFPNNKIAKLKQLNANCIEVMVHSNHLPKLFPHGKGVKHLRKIQIEKWQIECIDKFPEMFITGLFDSDGCEYTQTNTNIKYFQFTNASIDILDLYQKYLSKCDITSKRTIKRSGTLVQNIFVRKKSERTKFKELITRSYIDLAT